MSYTCGLVGLPNAGKTSLFRALTGQMAEVASYPFTTIDPHRGLVPVVDERLERVGAIAGSARLTPAMVEVVDVAGLVEGASRGEGLGNRFLSHIRDLDAVFHVVRCFPSTDVPHVTGQVSPARDAELVDTELLLADLETVERRRDKLTSLLKSGEPRWKKEAEHLEGLRHLLARGIPARLAEDEGALLLARELQLLTAKPILYVANVDERTVQEGASGRVEDPASDGGSLLAYVRRQEAALEVFSARMELELGELEPADRLEMLRELGWPSGGAQRLVQAGYRLLGLLTFFTANENECRARAVPRGSTAVEAAAKVHTDMAAGFIRAEVVSCPDLFRAGSFAAAREQGLVRVEGRSYQVQDGDVITFRFQR
ncbi:MAG TPA: redox-regulated ATPase YchF [Firmicutes bacterium]|nr:redox-regulated ATPase YchF [Bacillota bacterium]